jgi:hypothetical protein
MRIDEAAQAIVQPAHPSGYGRRVKQSPVPAGHPARRASDRQGGVGLGSPS